MHAGAAPDDAAAGTTQQQPAASGAAAAAATPPPPPASPQPQPASSPTPATALAGERGGAYAGAVGSVFAAAALAATLSLQLDGGLAFGDAAAKIARRVLRSVAFRQLLLIAGAILVVRFALNSALSRLARWAGSPVPWDKSRLYFVMKEVYAPLEVLLFVAGCCTLADAFLPQLLGAPRAAVHAAVRAALSLSFVLGAASVVLNLKTRVCKERAWQSEMQGDATAQRRWEAYDKLGGECKVESTGSVLGALRPLAL